MSCLLASRLRACNRAPRLCLLASPTDLLARCVSLSRHLATACPPCCLRLQSLVLAPLFVWFELLFLLNYRRRLRAEVQAVVDANIKEWKKHHQPLIAGADIGAQDSCAAGKE